MFRERVAQNGRVWGGNGPQARRERPGGYILPYPQLERATLAHCPGAVPDRFAGVRSAARADTIGSLGGDSSFSADAVPSCVYAADALPALLRAPSAGPRFGRVFDGKRIKKYTFGTEVVCKRLMCRGFR